ncbi:hypothetical protein LCGC14_2395940 [marine sediment metagenome]|uniref:Uncharacterized protein n=1 Tax=marine sediment metagenome TaxID=412755 RepID=A0A0F9CIV9_9ZZZZ
MAKTDKPHPSLIERRGRSCLVAGDKEILEGLVNEEISRQVRALKYQKATKKPEEIAKLKELKEMLGYDPTAEAIKDLEYLLKSLEVISVCPGTEPTLPMQEEDYPPGKLGGWQRIIFAEGKEEK